jgi:hypothetical protein
MILVSGPGWPSTSLACAVNDRPAHPAMKLRRSILCSHANDPAITTDCGAIENDLRIEQVRGDGQSMADNGFRCLHFSNVIEYHPGRLEKPA